MGSIITDTVGTGMFIAYLIQFLKGYLELLFPPSSSQHDAAVQLLAALVGIAGYVTHAATLAPLTGPIFWNNASQGALAGLSAVVTYHILSGTVPNNLPTLGRGTTIGLPTTVFLPRPEPPPPPSQVPGPP